MCHALLTQCKRKSNVDVGEASIHKGDIDLGRRGGKSGGSQPVGGGDRKVNCWPFNRKFASAGGGSTFSGKGASKFTIAIGEN